MKKKREMAIIDLVKATKTGNLQRVKHIVQNYEIYNIDVALFYALIKGHINIAIYLLNNCKCTINILIRAFRFATNSNKEEFIAFLAVSYKYTYFTQEDLVYLIHYDVEKFISNVVELNNKYQAQQEWNIQQYIGDYIHIHNLNNFLDKNILIDTNIMKFLSILFQHYIGENNQYITGKILNYIAGNEKNIIKNIFEVIKRKVKAIKIEGQKEKGNVVPGKDSCEDKNKDNNDDEENGDNNDDDKPNGGGSGEKKGGLQIGKDIKGRFYMNEGEDKMNTMEEEIEVEKKEAVGEIILTIEAKDTPIILANRESIDAESKLPKVFIQGNSAEGIGVMINLTNLESKGFHQELENEVCTPHLNDVM